MEKKSSMGIMTLSRTLIIMGRLKHKVSCVRCMKPMSRQVYLKEKYRFRETDIVKQIKAKHFHIALIILTFMVMIPDGQHLSNKNSIVFK